MVCPYLSLQFLNKWGQSKLVNIYEIGDKYKIFLTYEDPFPHIIM